MTRNPEANCEHCWNFAKDEFNRSFGHCRAHPPIVYSEDIDVSLYPVVTTDDWCGEWRTNYSD